MDKWYQISNSMLFIIFGLSVLWAVAGTVLYSLVGVRHGPDGGIDKIADAIVYVFVWRIAIFGVPVVASAVSFILWLYHNHRWAVKWLILLLLVVGVLLLLYEKHFKKYFKTPERVAGSVITYRDWHDNRMKRGTDSNWTEADFVCEYTHEIVSSALSEYYSMYDVNEKPDNEMRTAYLNAVMEARYRDIPHVEGWEYIPDVRDLISARKDGSAEFLLNNSELCAVGRHFKRELRRDHWYDKYQFERMVIAEWYSWLPMCAVFYDDGKMDLIIAT